MVAATCTSDVQAVAASSSAVLGRRLLDGAIELVLTPQRFHEHAEHHAFFSAHLFTKGQEAARALEAMLSPERGRAVPVSRGRT